MGLSESSLAVLSLLALLGTQNQALPKAGSQFAQLWMGFVATSGVQARSSIIGTDSSRKTNKEEEDIEDVSMTLSSNQAQESK